MDRLWSAISAIARFGIIAGGAMLFLAATIVTVEVMLRKVLPTCLGVVAWAMGTMSLGSAKLFAGWQDWARTMMFSGSDEISSYLFAVGTSWSMAYVLVTRGHIRIDALYGSLGARLRALFDIVALLLLGIFVAAMVERAYDVTSISYFETVRSNTNLRIWMALPQIPWFLGLALFLLAIVVALLRSVTALARGDLATVVATAGIATHEEEIASELKSLGIELQSREKV